MLIPRSETLADIFGTGASTKGSNPDLFGSSVGSPAKRHEAMRDSESIDGDLPVILIPADFDMQDFFADVATFYPSQSPITALIHVLDRDAAQLFRDRQKFPPSMQNNGRRILASLGVALGETMALGVVSSDPNMLPSYSACRRSLSFAINRGTYLYPSCEAEYIANLWVRLRKLTGLEVSDDILQTVVSAHVFIFGDRFHHRESGFSDSLRNAIAHYIQSYPDDREFGRVLASQYPGLTDVLYDFEGPFDGRMKAFTRVLAIVDRSENDSELGNLAIGYFCNCIYPGSFNHPRLLARVQDKYPSAMVWYGMFCALSEGFQVSQFATGLLSKLMRDVRQPFNSEARPLADISLEELEVLARLPLRSESIKPTNQKIISVSILPGVDLFSRFAQDDEKVSDYQRKYELARADTDSRIGRLLSEAISLLEHRSVPSQPLMSPQTVKRQRRPKG